MKVSDVSRRSLFKALNDVDLCIRMLLIDFFSFSTVLIVYYSLHVHSCLVKTHVDVNLKKINLYGTRKKLQLLNYLKGASSKICFPTEKNYCKNYKKIVES